MSDLSRNEIIASFQKQYDDLKKENEKILEFTPNGPFGSEIMDPIDREIINSPMERFLEKQLESKLKLNGFEPLTTEEKKDLENILPCK